MDLEHLLQFSELSKRDTHAYRSASAIVSAATSLYHTKCPENNDAWASRPDLVRAMLQKAWPRVSDDAFPEVVTSESLDQVAGVSSPQRWFEAIVASNGLKGFACMYTSPSGKVCWRYHDAEQPSASSRGGSEDQRWFLVSRQEDGVFAPLVMHPGAKSPIKPGKNNFSDPVVKKLLTFTNTEAAPGLVRAYFAVCPNEAVEEEAMRIGKELHGWGTKESFNKELWSRVFTPLDPGHNLDVVNSLIK